LLAEKLHLAWWAISKDLSYSNVETGAVWVLLYVRLGNRWCRLTSHQGTNQSKSINQPINKLINYSQLKKTISQSKPSLVLV